MSVRVNSAVHKPRALLLALLCSGIVTACGKPPEDMMTSAKEYLSRNDYSAASIQLKNALQEDANLAEARYLLGTVYLQQRNVAGALKELQRAQELGYPAEQLAPYLARVWVLSGKPEKVLEQFADIRIDDATQRAMLQAALGDAYAAGNEFAKALQAYDAALADVPEHLEARLGKARLAWVQNSAEAGLGEVQRALQAHPESPEAHALRGDLLSALQRPQESVQAYEQAVQLLPRATGYHYALIIQLLRMGQLDVAEVRLEQLQAIAPKDPGSQYLRAFVDFQRDRLDSARTAIEAVLRQGPDNIAAQLLAGAIYLKLEDHIQAQHYLESVLAKVPGQSLARRYLAASLLATGEAVRARELLEPVVSAEHDPVTMTLAGQAFLASGDFDQAAQYFTQAVEAQPDDVKARTRLAVASLWSGDQGRAVAELEEAVRLDASSGQPDLALVMTLLRAGEYDKALEAQQALEEKQPDNPQTYNLKGGIYLAKSNPAEARKAFEKALSLKADFLPAAVNLARLDVREGQLEAAEQRFTQVIAANPGSPDAYLMLADLKTRMGSSPADVKTILQRAAAARPSALGPKLAQVRFHLSQGETSQALALAREVAAAYPNDPGVLRVLAQTQMAGGEQEQALATLKRWGRLMPDSPSPLLALADAQRSMRDLHGAEQTLRRALTVQPHTLEVQQRLVSLLVEQKRYADAHRIATEIQKHRPQQVVGFVYAADIYAAEGKWSDAATKLREALQINADTSLAVKLHTVLVQSGQTQEAQAWAHQWTKAYPGDMGFPSYLAEKALSDKRYEEAEKIYRELVAKSADNPILLNNLAWVAGQLKHSDALELAQRAAQLAPENPAVLDTLGMLLVEQGMGAQGIEHLKKAVKLAPREVGLRINLARAHIALSQPQDARKELEAALQLAPEGSRVRDEIEKLQASL